MQPLPPGDLKELLSLLQTALELSEPDREQWLATLDPRKGHLKQTLADLLQKQAQFETDDFLQSLAEFTRSQGEGVPLPASPFAGALVGPYRLIQPIGEGGMSSVWLAERDDAVIRRRVALKLPHWWALTKLTDRAVQERDILASLEHPNIARLYDAGITSDGRPYLALEYIEGQPIDIYCRDRALELRTRVQLIAQIARAVAYAHSRLIVHRDLKPSNILIDAQGQTHLLDFGIAKLLEEGGPNKALTQVATLMLTPAYASPEQLLGQSVTTESDVYSLGLVAYELLTGFRPYTLKNAANTGWEVVSAHIHRPSDVTESGSDARLLRGDLDTIVLKALKKEPAERYGTAAAFADDLERYLRNDPVLAQPDSASYRLRKFAARNRLVVGAAVAVVAALAIGLAVSMWQLQVAREQRRHAEEVKEFTASIFRSADPFFTGKNNMSAAELLTFARERIDRELVSQPRSAAELLLIVGEAQSNLERTEEARATLEKALAVAAGSLPADSLPVAIGHSQLASIALQRSDYAVAEKELAIALPLLRAYGEEKEGARHLASSLMISGFIAGERGEGEQAIAQMQEAVDVLRKAFGADDSETILATRQRAQEYLLMGNAAEGLVAARAAHESAIRNFGNGGRNNLLAETEDVYGRALVDSGNLEEGIAHLQASIERAESILGPEADSVVSKLSWLARAQSKLGDLPGAIATLEKAVRISKDELSKLRPAMPRCELGRWIEIPIRDSRDIVTIKRIAQKASAHEKANYRMCVLGSKCENHRTRCRSS
ncbi:MAG TPA: serine/threonine-protein kinase [Povalibacter sp.]|uniref:serine/threonine protein kinase n=1 Tax=Povalibacter sp. TaxID=1962978 RepID=UPI002BACE21A|nr:serine/threonine-protein kinase [Povalibacter sp.]HMN43980.1 serine/threonine-protein kinase [Povalibacter sp.]